MSTEEIYKDKMVSKRSKVGNVLAGDYTETDNDGFSQLNGSARAWTDISMALDRTKQGANDKPDYDFTNLGLLFPQNNPLEIAYLIRQMDHAKALDTPIYLHVHYIQSGPIQPTFIAQYKYYLNGGPVPTSFTEVSTADNHKGIFTYPGSGSIMQIAAFPAIYPPEGETVSGHFEVKLFRNDNDVTGDVLTKYIDFHYLRDSHGSREQFAK